MAKDNYLPSSFQINVDPAINEREGKQAWRRIKRGSALEDQLKLARWLAYGSRLAQAEAGVQRAEGRGYSVAFNRWLLEHDMAAVSAQMRANAIFVIDNWPEAEMAIANANDHQKQTWALNGLRTAIEMARSDKWRAAERKPPREKPYNYGDGAWRAMVWCSTGRMRCSLSATRTSSSASRDFSWVSRCAAMASSLSRPSPTTCPSPQAPPFRQRLRKPWSRRAPYPPRLLHLLIAGAGPTTRPRRLSPRCQRQTTPTKTRCSDERLAFL